MRNRYSVLLVDLDGVIWRRNKVIIENTAVIKQLELQSKYTIIYMTNNSTVSRKGYLTKLNELGIPVSIERIYNSGYLASLYIVERGKKPTLVVGEEGLIEEVLEAGIPLCYSERGCSYVVVGLDRHTTYSKLARALHNILSGALFIATNEDPLYPVEDRYDPGAGALVAFLSKASGRKPDFIAGKPNPWIINVITKKFKVDKDEILIIGDNMVTDIALGAESNVDTLLVLTGVSKEDMIYRYTYRPTYIVRNLKEAIDKSII